MDPEPIAPTPSEPPQTSQPRNPLLRVYLEMELLRYALSATIVVAITLLVPPLLNNMLLMFGVLLLGVSVLPALLRRRSK